MALHAAVKGKLISVIGDEVRFTVFNHKLSILRCYIIHYLNKNLFLFILSSETALTIFIMVSGHMRRIPSWWDW